MTMTIQQREQRMQGLLDDVDPSAIQDYEPLQPGNTKLGNNEGIYHTSHLPLVGCCGATEACAKVCYAFSFMARYKNSGDWNALGTHLLINERGKYFAKAQAQIAYLVETNRVDAIRWHVGGDFIDADHVERWHRLARLFPDVPFWAYTRSWRPGGDILEALEELRSLDNVQLFASVDDECRDQADEMVPDWRRADIVDPDTEPGWSQGSLVCPQQIEDSDVTCSSCTYCYDDREGNVDFLLH